jgi:hypothetical protein
MTTPTPVQLRQAAGHLAKAVDTMCTTSWEHVREAEDCLPEGAIEREALGGIDNWRDWYQTDPNYTAWLADAVRWRLLLEALWQEKPVLDETRADSWRELAAWKATWAALVEELLAGTPAPAAGE